MSRKKRDYSRPVIPDPKFKDPVVTKLICVLMRSGKKSIAEKALYSAFDFVAEKTKENPLDVFDKAISNVKPTVEVRSRRVGGANYQVPTEVRPQRAQSLALRWLVQAASERGERELSGRIAGELLDAAQNRGGAVKKREDTHRMADANKAFAHFRW